MMKSVLVILLLVPAALCQVNVGSCNGKWNQYVNCLKNGVAQQAKNDGQFPMPDQGTQNRLKKAVDNCFKQQGCYSSPVPSTQETNARRECFKQAKKQLDDQLNRCVDSKIRGWNPPNDYARIEIDEWGYTVSRVYDAARNPRSYCGRSDGRTSQAIQQCIRRDANSQGFNFERKPPRSLPSYWCREDARCWDATTDKCQQDFDRYVQPELCSCAKRLNIDRFISQAKQNYDDCVNRRVSEQVSNDEPGPVWIEEYVRNLCNSKNNNPCRNERRQYENRG
jgi:hypothetical protein